MGDTTVTEPAPELSCNFCGKKKTAVKTLIVGKQTADGQAGICDECIVACIEILIDEQRLGASKDLIDVHATRLATRVKDLIRKETLTFMIKYGKPQGSVDATIPPAG